MTTIPAIKLNNGAKMPVLGLGTWQLKGKKCTKAVKMALDAGYRHVDTAFIYENQKEVGEGIKGFERKKLFVTSKLWRTELRFERALKACYSTLEELGTDYLDMYLIHWPDRNVPIKGTLEALEFLKKEGAIRAFGVSNFTQKHMEKALGCSKEIATNQVEFHPLLFQKELLEYCGKKDIVLTAYSPIARGKVFENETLNKMGEKYGKSAAQIALRWLVQKGIVVIPKASSREHIEQNMDLFGWRISGADSLAIDNIGKNERMVVPHFAEF